MASSFRAAVRLAGCSVAIAVACGGQVAAMAVVVLLAG